MWSIAPPPPLQKNVHLNFSAALSDQQIHQFGVDISVFPEDFIKKKTHPKTDEQ